MHTHQHAVRAALLILLTFLLPLCIAQMGLGGSGEHSGASLYQRSLGRSQPHGVCKPCAENHHLKTKNTRMASHGGQVNWRMGSHSGNGIHGLALKSAHPAEFRQIEAGNGTDPFFCVWGGGVGGIQNLLFLCHTKGWLRVRRQKGPRSAVRSPASARKIGL